MRLGFFVDQIFWRDGETLSTNESYILFVQSLVDSTEGIDLIGRLAPEQNRAPYVLTDPRISLVPLPFYRSVQDLWRVWPSVYGQARRLIGERASSWDALLISGPHPIGQMVARQYAARGVSIVPVVRQNLVEQMQAIPGLRRLPAVAAAHLCEWDFRRLARGRVVLVVGEEMAAAYSRYSTRVINHFPCLVDDAQFRVFSAMSTGADPRRLLCVCRLAPEKGHKFLFEALAVLERAGLKLCLDVVGGGPLRADLEDRASALGLADRVTFHGYVGYGPKLFALYQSAGAFVLPSLTEGFPQVINESLSIGLPTIATRVGGVPAFLTHEDTALLVPPADVAALAKAIERMATDAALRHKLRVNGRELMRRNTLEINRARVMEGIRDAIDAPAR